MALDLSELEDLAAPAAPPRTQADGKPLELALSDVMEDPNQPRKEFSAEKMAEMVASIQEVGVKTPISVRTHPALPGKYLINYGARRYRGSVGAGKTTIPAFVDEAHDNYDQVIENLQREGLTPLELAMFISDRLSEGAKKGEIAKRLGKKPAFITEHLALVDAPALILDLYRAGALTSPRTIYDLRQLHDKHPAEVEAFLSTHQGDVERKTVEQLADAIKNPPAPAQKPPALRHDENAGVVPPSQAAEPQAGSTGNPDGASEDAGNRSDPSSDANGGTATLVSHNPQNEKALQPKSAPPADQTRLKKPVMLVEFDGRAAMVLLWNRPSTPGLLKIKYEDNSEEAEVDAGQCKINCLLEATA